MAGEGAETPGPALRTGLPIQEPPTAVSTGAGSLPPKRSLLKKHPWITARSARRLLRKQLASPARSIFRQVSLGGVFVVVLTALHLLLEMMGRRYHDEFSQFHDHEHWPGKCILALRVMLWVIFLGGALMTHNGCKKGSELRSSMVSLAAFGSVWLLAFPVTVVVARAETLPSEGLQRGKPAHRRRLFWVPTLASQMGKESSGGLELY